MPETRRLLLHSRKEEDAEKLFELAKDPETEDGKDG